MSDYKISKEDSTEVFPADSTEVHESSPGVSETIMVQRLWKARKWFPVLLYLPMCTQ